MLSLRWLVLQNCVTVVLLGAAFSLAQLSRPLQIAAAAAAMYFFLLALSLSIPHLASLLVLIAGRG